MILIVLQFEVFLNVLLENLYLQTALQEKPFSDALLAKYDKQPPEQNILYACVSLQNMFHGIKLIQFSIKSFLCFLFHTSYSLPVSYNFILIED